MKNCSIFVFLFLLTITCQSAKKQQVCSTDKPLYHVPEINGFKLDGKADEWADNGLKVKLFCDANGTVITSDSLEVNFRLAWNKEGLCVFIEVTDPEIIEAQPQLKKNNSDGFEIFVSDKFAGRNMLQYVVTLKDGKCVSQLWDGRGSRKVAGKPAEIQIVNTRTARGINYELLIPFSYLDVTPREGKEIGFQLYVNDVNQSGVRKRLEWYYQATSYLSAQYLETLVLDKKASPDVNYAVRADIIDEDTAVVQVVADKAWAGKKLELSGGSSLANVLFTVKGPVAIARFSLPVQKLAPVEKTKLLLVDSKVVANIDFETIDYIYKKKPAINFSGEVRWYKKINRENNLPKNPVLFVGHSMFRFWKTFAEDMAGIPALNRAIGGAQITDLVHHYDILFKPYHPSKIVLYIGSNDINTGKTPEKAFAEFRFLFNKLRTDYPEVPIFFCTAFEHKYAQNGIKIYDEMVMDFIAKQPKATVIDFRKVLEDKDGHLTEGIFHPDHVHLTSRGYSIILPVIKEAIR